MLTDLNYFETPKCPHYFDNPRHFIWSGGHLDLSVYNSYFLSHLGNYLDCHVVL